MNRHCDYLEFRHERGDFLALVHLVPGTRLIDVLDAAATSTEYGDNAFFNMTKKTDHDILRHGLTRFHELRESFGFELRPLVLTPNDVYACVVWPPHAFPMIVAFFAADGE